jgi:hypothetical protein
MSECDGRVGCVRGLTYGRVEVFVGQVAEFPLSRRIYVDVVRLHRCARSQLLTVADELQRCSCVGEACSAIPTTP